MLESTFDTPMARNVPFGCDLRRNGSILSTALMVASDSMPSMSVSVTTMTRMLPQSSGRFHTVSNAGGVMPPWRISAGMAIKYRASRSEKNPSAIPMAQTVSGAGILRSHAWRVRFRKNMRNSDSTPMASTGSSIRSSRRQCYR